MNSDRHDATRRAAKGYLGSMQNRRSCRSFSDDPVPESAVRDCIAAAGTAPSGANMQPWTFVLVAEPEMKRRIRIAAELVEREFYARRVSEEWKGRLEPLGVDAEKEFLEDAQYLICIFLQKYGINGDGGKVKHYYPRESVGIATGFLISALHQAGLASLPYTPAPMAFLAELLKRPRNESPFLILAVGYPAENYTPPAIERKPLSEILVD